jgi:hypothetical protein
MRTNRRSALATLAVLCGASCATSKPGPAKNQTNADAEHLIGSWHTTSAITTFILNLEPSREGLLIVIENGSSDVRRVIWEPKPGGLMTLTFPKLRLWLGRHSNECRAEVEDLAELEVSDTLKQFPQAFFMRRIESQAPHASNPLNNIPIPPHWSNATLPEDWNSKAGKRRPSKI